MNIRVPCLIVLPTVLVIGCGPSLKVAGNSRAGYHPMPGCAVSPAQAVKLAEPYLEQTFQLRQQKRDLESRFDTEPADHVIRNGDWYYIVRENYPAIFASFYLAHAVRVHCQTGEVIPPE